MMQNILRDSEFVSAFWSCLAILLVFLRNPNGAERVKIKNFKSLEYNRIFSRMCENEMLVLIRNKDDFKVGIRASFSKVVQGKSAMYPLILLVFQKRVRTESNSTKLFALKFLACLQKLYFKPAYEK